MSESVSRRRDFLKTGVAGLSFGIRAAPVSTSSSADNAFPSACTGWTFLP